MTFICEEIPSPSNDNNPECQQCSARFVFRKGKKFCSRSCKKRHGDRSENKHKNGVECTCLGCGIAFKRRTNSRNKGSYCSRECAFANMKLASSENRDLADSFRVIFSVSRCKCVDCARWFDAGSVAAQRCDKCRYIAANDNGRDRAPRPCGECGSVFAPEYGDRRRTFCSSRCNAKNARRISKPKQRARLRNARIESVDPLKVFDRDGWRCQFCRVKTPKKLRGTYEPNAPELDHIIPLSVGGEHSYRNTQCLCRKCNSDKSNNILGQLRLFG